MFHRSRTLRLVDQAPDAAAADLNDVAHESADRLNQAAEQMGAVAQDILGRLEGWGRERKDELRENVKADPFVWLAVSAGVGAFVGLAAFAIDHFNRPAKRPANRRRRA